MASHKAATLAASTRSTAGTRWVCAALLFAAEVAGSATVGAATVDDRLLFTASGQSQWRSGAALEFNTHGPQFVGIPGFHFGDSIGDIREDCLAFVCSRIGAKLGLEGNVRAGLNYDVLISDGSLRITLPQHVTYSVPDPLAIKQGGVFNIVSTLVPTTIYTISADRIALDGHIGPTIVKAGLQTTGPTVQALIGLELKANLQAIAQACFVAYCIGPNLEVGVDKTQEVLALNHNGDRQLRVLGEPVVSAETRQSFNDGTIAVTAQLPTLNTDSRARADGFDLATGNLQSANRANVATVTALLDRIVTKLLGLPPLNNTSEGFGYNIVTANAGLNIDVAQKFTFDPDLQATLNFTSPVIVGVDGVFNPALRTNSVSFRVGDTISLRAPSALSLGVAPEYRLDNATRNETGLQVDGKVNVTAGAVDIFGLTIGPLVREPKNDAPVGLANVPLFGDTFRVNTANIRTNPFNIAFALANDTAFADQCLAVDPAACDRSGLFGFNPAVCFSVFDGCRQPNDVADQIYLIDNLYNLIDTSAEGDDCVRFDAFGRPCNTIFALETLIPELIAGAHTSLFGSTSEFLFDENGERTYLSETLAALLANEPDLPVTNDTDEGASERLLALGFDNTFAQFDIPQGAPLPVPEPPGLTGLLLAGSAGLVWLRGRWGSAARRRTPVLR